MIFGGLTGKTLRRRQEFELSFEGQIRKVLLQRISGERGRGGGAVEIADILGEGLVLQGSGR